MFKSLDSLVIGGGCRLRRVFTLRDAPYDALGMAQDQFAGPAALPLPRGFELPPELDTFTQVRLLHCAAP